MSGYYLRSRTIAFKAGVPLPSTRTVGWNNEGRNLRIRSGRDTCRHFIHGGRAGNRLIRQRTAAGSRHID